MKILWLGPIVNSTIESESNGISPAGNIWQKKFLSGLLKNKVEVINLSYVVYSSWPKGPLYFTSKNIRPLQSFNQHYLRYINIIGIREVCIAIGSLYYLISKKVKFDYVFSYNESLRNRLLIWGLKKFRSFKWISVIADDYTYGNADLTIFLSYSYYKRFASSDKLFFEGGIDKVVASQEFRGGGQYLLYAGSMTKITGIVDFVKWYLKSDLKYSLQLFGKPSDEIVELASMDKRIVLKGFVTSEELDAACRHAYALISPRGVGITAENTFPSKLLMYLKYNKVILSYKSESIPSYYDKFVTYYEAYDEIPEILDDDMLFDRSNLLEEHRKFVESHSWEGKTLNILNELRLRYGAG